MKKTMLILVAVLTAAFLFACGDDNPLKEYTDADPNTSCGRYCIKCSTCKDEGLEGYIKQIVDVTCYMDELGKACETACDLGDGTLPLKENTEQTEEAIGKEITDPSFTCDQFALAVASGQTPGGVCYDFCSKCVDCSSDASVGADGSQPDRTDQLSAM